MFPIKLQEAGGLPQIVIKQEWKKSGNFVLRG